MTGAGPAIEAEAVTRTYAMGQARVVALRGVSLRVEPGDFVAVVGPSGSGKSTLMHLLGGLDRPTSGRLVIGGRDVATLSQNQLAQLRNRTIGFVFQSFHLLPRTSAVDNVALPLVYRGVPVRARRQRAAAMLGRVGLAHRLDHRPSQLSGGEQQRVAIARALVTDPTVLLADEPTGNLDSATGEAVLALLHALNESSGVAVVLVTHDRSVAARARRQIVMRDGLVVATSDATAAPGAPEPGPPGTAGFGAPEPGAPEVAASGAPEPGRAAESGAAEPRAPGPGG